MRRALPTLLALILLPACVVVSRHAFVGKDQAIFDEALLGRWVDPDKEDSDAFVFERDGESGYRVTTDEEKRPEERSVFRARLGEIAGGRYLDAVEVKEPAPAVEEHILVQISLEGDDLRLALLETRYFRERAEGKRGKVDDLEFEVEEGKVVLTSATEVLRAFLEAHHADEGLFGEGDVLRRAK